eukprot:TRINITY_DN9246_c0_g1_i1.p1 TRINITY_DN9246_c0_g1~~TRINITY_DN9246_c0_g1_i1.p1  ORF type:complete len:177 (+),score=25.92 TRINITY_DN9246_c0_g1_i1:188-718(+)
MQDRVMAPNSSVSSIEDDPVLTRRYSMPSLSDRGWICVGCGENNCEGAKKCKNCSQISPFEGWVCKKCSFSNRSDIRYCKSCRTQRPEKKLLIRDSGSFKGGISRDRSSSLTMEFNHDENEDHRKLMEFNLLYKPTLLNGFDCLKHGHTGNFFCILGQVKKKRYRTCFFVKMSCYF